LTVEVGKEKFCTTLGQILKLRLWHSGHITPRSVFLDWWDACYWLDFIFTWVEHEFFKIRIPIILKCMQM
jgi:hypothetical protein